MNSMTIAMQEAVAKAGTPLRMPSQLQIVWTWLKDHPDRTAKEIATAVHLPVARANFLLWDLFQQRGMASRKWSSRHGKGKWEYAALGSTYELLPKKRATPEGKAISAAAAAERAESSAPAPKSARAVQVFDIESYTLGELRSIYAQLKQLFG